MGTQGAISCHLLVKRHWSQKSQGLKNQAFMYLKYLTREPLGCDFTHVDAASGETATGVRSKYLVWTGRG